MAARCLIKNVTVFCLFAIVCIGNALGQPQRKDAEDTRILGCIQRSDQNYTIVDSHGSSYVLTGVGEQLVGEVGHTLEVRGTLVDNTARSQADNPSENGIPVKLLRVANVTEDVHRVGDHCSAH